MALLSGTRAWLTCASVLLVLALPWAAAAQPQTIEDDVKAAYLYNFTKFVEWPAATVPADRFRICVVGDRAFARAVEGIVQGEVAQGRPLAHVEPQSPDEARGCQILFIGSQDPEGGARMLAAVRQLPVLTVGEAPAFLDQGGTIRFVLVDGRVRFQIAPRPLERVGLRVSSKLLRVAHRVDDRSPR